MCMWYMWYVLMLMYCESCVYFLMFWKLLSYDNDDVWMMLYNLMKNLWIFVNNDQMMLCLFIYYPCIPIYVMMNILTPLLLLLCIMVSVLLGVRTLRTRSSSVRDVYKVATEIYFCSLSNYLCSQIIMCSDL